MQILAICAVLLGQAALIGWLIYEHRRRHLAEAVARNSMIGAHSHESRRNSGRVISLHRA